MGLRVIDTLLVILASISAFICGITLVLLICGIYKRKHEKPNSTILILTYSAIILFVISMTTFVFFLIAANDIENIIFDATSTITWNLAQFIVYILLFARLYYAFAETKYTVTKYATIWFGIWLILYMLCIVAFVVWSIRSPIKNKIDLWGNIYAISEEVIDLILSTYLITLFIRKLYNVTVDFADNQSAIHINSNIALLNENQKQLINIMTKYFILSFVATLTTQIESLLYCVGYFLIHKYHIIWDIGWLFWPIDCVANSICLLLIFEMNDRRYNKLCKRCHSCIKLFLATSTKQKLKKKYLKENEHVEYEITLLTQTQMLTRP